MHSALCLVFACKICKKCKITSRCHIDGISIPLLLATGVFRVATKCGYGPTKGRESPLSTEGRQEAVWIYMSIPYWLQIHSTALGGSIFDLRFTPNRANWQRFSFNHRQKVVRLTPAASANSVLYALFMVVICFWQPTTDYRLQICSLSVDCCLFFVYKFTKNNRYLQGNHEKNTLYCYLLFQIVSACLNASFGCRNFVLDLEIHHESAHARDSKSAACSPLA